jgi:hypothetical protein
VIVWFTNLITGGTGSWPWVVLVHSNALGVPLTFCTWGLALRLSHPLPPPAACVALLVILELWLCTVGDLGRRLDVERVPRDWFEKV